LQDDLESIVHVLVHCASERLPSREDLAVHRALLHGDPVVYFQVQEAKRLHERLAAAAIELVHVLRKDHHSPVDFIAVLRKSAEQSI
jgi:hypothetical protein